MLRWNEIISFLLLINITQLKCEEIKDTNVLSRNDSYSPKLNGLLYKGPYERILSIAEIKDKIFRISKKPYLTQANGKAYKMHLFEREYYAWLDIIEDEIEIALA